MTVDQHRRTCRRSILLALLIMSAPNAVAQDLTTDALQDMLRTRDAAIIELQQIVRQLSQRLEAIEQDAGPDRPAPAPSPQIGLATAPSSPPQSAGTLVVDEQAAQRALERTLIQGGALLLPSGRMEFNPTLTYGLNQFDLPGFALAGDEFELVATDREQQGIAANVDFRLGLPFDSQLELGLPYLWVDEEITILSEGAPPINRSGHGFGSLSIGLAKSFMQERGWRPDVIGRLIWETGSGKQSDGNVFLGGGFKSWSGSFTFTKRSDPLVFLGSLSYRTFLDNDIKPGDEWGFSFGTAFAMNPVSSLFATIDNRFSSDTRLNDVRVDGSDRTSISLNLGASTFIARGILLNLSTNIGISDDAPDYSVGLSTSMQTDIMRQNR